jgi:hypothetical protein
MELSRRDAIAALFGAGGVAGAAALAWDALDEEQGFAPKERDRLVALARVLFPGVVEGVPEFVETYAVGRVRDRPAYATGMQDALATLDEYAREWKGSPWLDLSPDGRDALLREMGVDEADPGPDGLAHERVRYYLVDELLYALYTSPTGGELVGVENPIGHPGGTASYRRPPPGADVQQHGHEGGGDG